MLKNGNSYLFLQHLWSTNKQFMNRNLGIWAPLGEPFSYERWNSPMHQELEHLQDEHICILKKDLLSYYFTHLSFPRERKQRGDLVCRLILPPWYLKYQNTFQEVFKKQNTPKKAQKKSTPWQMAEENHEHNIFLLHNLCPYFMLILGCLNLQIREMIEDGKLAAIRLPHCHGAT